MDKAKFKAAVWDGARSAWGSARWAGTKLAKLAKAYPAVAAFGFGLLVAGVVALLIP